MKIQSAVFIAVMMLGSALCAAATEGGSPGDTKSVEAGPKDLDLKNLLQHWVHSREEQKDLNAAEQTFRPAGSRQFPPSRFRMAYKFSEGGACEWMFLSPRDAHEFKPGKWKVEDQNILTITGDGRTTSFRIIELSKDILRLAPAAKP